MQYGEETRFCTGPLVLAPSTRPSHRVGRRRPRQLLDTYLVIHSGVIQRFGLLHGECATGSSIQDDDAMHVATPILPPSLTATIRIGQGLRSLQRMGPMGRLSSLGSCASRARRRFHKGEGHDRCRPSPRGGTPRCGSPRRPDRLSWRAPRCAPTRKRRGRDGGVPVAGGWMPTELTTILQAVRPGDAYKSDGRRRNIADLLSRIGRGFAPSLSPLGLRALRSHHRKLHETGDIAR
jgi:hypothetical protein